MERKLIINLLPWRERKLFHKKIQKGVVVFLIFLTTGLTLFFLYKEEKNTTKPTTHPVATINTNEQNAFKAQKQWAFLRQFFNIISNQLPSSVLITSLSQETGDITLTGTANNEKDLNLFLKQLSDSLKNSTVKLIQLSEKETISFSVLLSPHFQPGIKEINNPPFDRSAWMNQIASKARNKHLAIDIKPTENNMHFLVEGDYQNILLFFFEMNQSKWPVLLKSWHMQPAKKIISIEINSEVIQ